MATTASQSTSGGSFGRSRGPVPRRFSPVRSAPGLSWGARTRTFVVAVSLLRLVACAWVLSSAAAPLAAAGTGRVSGRVLDPAGAPVPGASVALLSPQGAIAATARSDAAGAFQLDAVPTGSYVLTAGAPGFATRRLALQVEADRAVDDAGRGPAAGGVPRRGHRHRHARAAPTPSRTSPSG